MKNNTTDFVCGQLVAVARSILDHHDVVSKTEGFKQEMHQLMQDRCEAELKRIINNTFQFHGNEIGDPVQLAALILLMHGEQHLAAPAITLP